MKFLWIALAGCRRVIYPVIGLWLSVAVQAEPASLMLWKDPNCGCCDAWAEHAEQNGFTVARRAVLDLDARKRGWGIEPRWQSCHTAQHTDGWVFEGHVPAALIQQFLQQPPANALGLSVPGMPIGSPGMEMGERRDPYTVWLLDRDGGATPYARVDRLGQWQRVAVGAEVLP